MSKKRYLPEGFIRVWRVEKGYSLELGEPTDLIYNLEEKIIYYYFNDRGIRSLCPYYGKTGKACTIKAFKIVEV